MKTPKPVRKHRGTRPTTYTLPALTFAVPKRLPKGKLEPTPGFPCNVPALLRVRAHILAEPKRLRMECWARAEDGPTAPACGTVGCIGGWAAILHLQDRNPLRTAADLAEATWLSGGRSATEFMPSLGMDPANEEHCAAANRLFLLPDMVGWWKDSPHWPSRFARAYKQARTPLARARVVAARIDHWLLTRGAE